MIFRIFGDKIVKYYTDINAESDDDAMMAAKQQESHKWFEISTDSTIQPYDIELINDNFVQLELDNSDI